MWRTVFLLLTGMLIASFVLQALAAEGEDEVCKVQEEYEGELERMRHKLVDLQLKLEWYEKELASHSVKH